MQLVNGDFCFRRYYFRVRGPSSVIAFSSLQWQIRWENVVFPAFKAQRCTKRHTTEVTLSIQFLLIIIRITAPP